MTTPHPVRSPACITTQRSRQPGFALIIVLTLMAFLVLLFVTLTISIQVSNDVSQYNLKATQARLNALYGVSVAMAQLQKFAGPDTRVTGTADLARRSDPNGDPSTQLPAPVTGTVNGSGVTYNYAYNPTLDAASGLTASGVNAPNTIGGTRYWTGVWGNAAPSYGIYQGNTPATSGTNSATAMPTPVLLTWLVSGDESTPLALTQNATTQKLTITSATAATPTFAPSITLNDGTTALVSANATDSLAISGMTIAGNPANATLLVGPNSAGNTSYTTYVLNGAPVPQLPQSRYVAAPLVPLNVPGDEDVQPVATGSYAYWVGDEGVKAKYNMVDSYGNSSVLTNATVFNTGAAANFTSTASDEITGPTGSANPHLPKGQAYLYRLMAPQRAAIEEMAGLSSYSLNNSGLKSMDELMEGHYLTPGDSIADETVTTDPLREHFHDISTYSMGVLADSLRGGLKYDLTTAFEQPGVYSNDLATAGVAKNILPDGTGNNSTNPISADYGAPAVSPKKGPTWSAIQSYYNIGSAIALQSNVGSVPIQPGVIPVVVQGRLLFGFLLDSSEQVDMSLCAGFILANPYNYTISASQGLSLNLTINTHTQSEWGFYISGTFSPAFPNSEDVGTRYSNAAGNTTSYYTILNNKVDWGHTANSMLDNVTFHLSDAGTSTGSLTLQPGQAKLYAIAGSGTTSYTSLLDKQEQGSGINTFFSYVSSVGILPASGPRTIQLGSSGSASTGKLSNFVLISSGAKLSTAPTTPHDLFTTGFLPSVACTLQMFAPTGSVFSPGGSPTTTPTILQSIMDLDLTGDGVGGTIPGVPIDIKNNPSGDEGTISDGTGGTGGAEIPHFQCGYYFWLGLPDSGSFYTIGSYNYSNYINVSPTGAAEFGYSAPFSTSTAFSTMPLLDMATGVQSSTAGLGGKTFNGINYRTFTDFNVRAANIALPPSAPLNVETKDGYSNITANSSINNGFPNVPPYLRLFDPTSGTNDQAGLVDSDVQFMTSGNFGYNVGLLNGAAAVPLWGHVNSNEGQAYVTLFDLPFRNLAGTTNVLPVLSLGQLQHADVTADDLFNSVGYQPGNAFGNSYASPFVGTGQSVLPVQSFSPDGQQSNLKGLTYAQLGLGSNTTPAFPAANNNTVNAYDISYLINAALWDRYYFSGVNQGANTYPIAATPANSMPSLSYGTMSNPRMRFAAGFSPNYTLLNITTSSNTPSTATLGLGVPDLETSTTSQTNYIPQGYALSRYLMNDGAFNINSTSVEAWKAVLASLRGLPPATSAATMVNSLAAPTLQPNAANPVLAFPRVSASLITGGNGTYMANYTYNGSVSNAPNAGDSNQSFAGFRTLTDQDITNLATLIVQQVRVRGPFLSLAQFVNRRLVPTTSTLLSQKSIDPTSLSGPIQSAIDALPASAGGTGTFNTMTELTTSNGDGVNGDNVTFLPSDSYQPIGPMLRSTGIPGWLTQADLLQSLAPVLSARSDTFIIRAYGQVNNPLDNSVQSRAWCEAVVQRLPEYLDTQTQNGNNGLPDNPGIMPWQANYQNNVFGRRFSLVSLRWLNSNDI